MEFTDDGRTVWTTEERAAIAAEQDAKAAFFERQADELDAKDNPTAALSRRWAQEAHDLANAARTSNAALARLY
jgi:hypothetical protein